MMFCMRDLWHNFEYENEQVTNKEKSHSYIHHWTAKRDTDFIHERNVNDLLK